MGTLETGQSALPNVDVVLKRDAENVTTLRLRMVVQTVKEITRKGELVMLIPAQVTFSD
jgi:hypothetical protein